MSAAVKDRPILFSAPMVRALLDGSKTQTRRIVKDLPPWPITEFHLDGGGTAFDLNSRGTGKWLPNGPAPCGRGMASGHWRICPHGQPGDRLWVRETHRPIFGQTCGLIAVDYQADPREKWERLGDSPDSLVKPTKWIPSIHMRREYSRILLEVVSVRVERLTECSVADAAAEGVKPDVIRQFAVYGATVAERAAIRRIAALAPYQRLWESINGTGSWVANPWVWVIEFKRVDP